MSQETVIRPPAHLKPLDLRELLRYRHMLVARVRKNIKVQFQDMYLGYAWAIAQPLLVVAVFAWLKNVTAAKMNVPLPYPLYLFTGLTLWYYFTGAATAVSVSVRRDAGLIKKVYYPRLITPLVPLIEHLFELAISVVPLFLMMLWYDVYPGWRLVLLPLVLIQCMALTMGLGCLWAALSLTRADLDRVLRHAFYLGLFVSPVILAPSSSWQSFLHANPMVGTLLAFRSCLFADFPFPVKAWAYSVAFSAALVFIGLHAYRKAESDFLDEL